MQQILACVPAEGHQRRDLQRLLANLPDIIGRINELANYIHAALARRAPAGGQVVIYLGNHTLQLSGRILDIILTRPTQIAGVLLIAHICWKLRQMGLLDLVTWIVKMFSSSCSIDQILHFGTRPSIDCNECYRPTKMRFSNSSTGL